MRAIVFFLVTLILPLLGVAQEEGVSKPATADKNEKNDGLVRVAGTAVLQVFEERGFYEEVAAALRYGQKIAVGSGCPVRVTLTASSYDLKQQAASGNRCDPADATWAVAVMMPTGQAAAGSAPTGIALGPVTTFQLDGLGQTNLGSDLTVTVGALTLTVQAESGYVQIP